MWHLQLGADLGKGPGFVRFGPQYAETLYNDTE
jgi:hypothetical protein